MPQCVRTRLPLRGRYRADALLHGVLPKEQLKPKPQGAGAEIRKIGQTLMGVTKMFQITESKT